MMPTISKHDPMPVGETYGKYQGFVERKASDPVPLYYPGVAQLKGDTLTRHEYRPTLLTIGEAVYTAQQMARDADIKRHAKLPEDPFSMQPVKKCKVGK